MLWLRTFPLLVSIDSLGEADEMTLSVLTCIAEVLLETAPGAENDPEYALELMQRVCELAAPPLYAQYKSALAEAQFQVGDVAGALETQRELLAVLPDGFGLAGEFEADLARYEAAGRDL